LVIFTTMMLSPKRRGYNWSNTPATHRSYTELKPLGSRSFTHGPWSSLCLVSWSGLKLCIHMDLQTHKVFIPVTFAALIRKLRAFICIYESYRGWAPFVPSRSTTNQPTHRTWSFQTRDSWHTNARHRHRPISLTKCSKTLIRPHSSWPGS